MNPSAYLSENYTDQAGCIPIKIKKDVSQLTVTSNTSTSTAIGDGSVSTPHPIFSMLTLNDFYILLVTSGTSGEHWVFPKGSIKKGEKKKVAAKRETLEESGLKGKIIKDLEPIILADHHKGVNLTYFPYLIKDKKKSEKKSAWQESSKRQRKWFPISQVLQMIAPVKTHIESATIHLQRQLGLYLHRLNLELNLSQIPLSDYDKNVRKSIEDHITHKEEKKKKKKKEKKKALKKSKMISTEKIKAK
ncbi:hypothetical protein DLAC_09826 [Tieghemostelium lacteum]|uniref:Nudix hydrolase domain-containing protein n=1 Tax=Tieghemostelium lacteum TaxID=361077 RepID=A0A151Z7B3_TIELA|nr:hypothetical protein DLAC_09826 [Tieghemostelium lacteum]|eukprot:KYQ89851.1 hypothetical protein DLAC_09826 [Tieghemostelium lacteum]